MAVEFLYNQVIYVYLEDHVLYSYYIGQMWFYVCKLLYRANVLLHFHPLQNTFGNQNIFSVKIQLILVNFGFKPAIFNLV